MRAYQSMGKGVGGHQHRLYDGSVRLHRVARGKGACIRVTHMEGIERDLDLCVNNVDITVLNGTDNDGANIDVGEHVPKPKMFVGALDKSGNHYRFTKE